MNNATKTLAARLRDLADKFENDECILRDVEETSTTNMYQDAPGIPEHVIRIAFIDRKELTQPK